MADLITVGGLGAASFLGVVALMPLARRVAVSYDIVAAPGASKLHLYPIPYLGGVVMALTALGASTFLPGWSVEAAVILLGAMLVGAVGLVDDMRALSPAPRLLAETIAATMAAAAGARVHLFNDPLDILITVAWLVVITNSFNLLDNMDGVAAIIATVTSLGLVLAAGLEGQWLVGGMAALVAGSSLGFLVFNWHPAKVFMGDAGSLFLGYMLGATALKLRFPVGHMASVPAILLLTGPALFDTTLVVISRVRAGRPIYLGATDHTSHRLLRLGLGTGQVAVVLGAASAVCTGLGVAVGRGALPAGGVGAAAAVAAGAGLVWFLRLPHGNDGAAAVPVPPVDVSRVLSTAPGDAGTAL